MSSSCAITPTRGCTRRSTKFAWLCISSPHCVAFCAAGAINRRVAMKPGSLPDSRFPRFEFAFRAPFVNYQRAKDSRVQPRGLFCANAELWAEGERCASLFTFGFQNIACVSWMPFFGRRSAAWQRMELTGSARRKYRRSLWGCDAVQRVRGYSGKPAYAITFAVSAAGSGNWDGETTLEEMEREHVLRALEQF